MTYYVLERAGPVFGVVMREHINLGGIRWVRDIHQATKFMRESDAERLRFKNPFGGTDERVTEHEDIAA